MIFNLCFKINFNYAVSPNLLRLQKKSSWNPIPFYVKLEIQVLPEHYKTLMKEMKTNKWKGIHVHGSEEVILLKISILSKVIYSMQ